MTHEVIFALIDSVNRGTASDHVFPHRRSRVRMRLRPFAMNADWSPTAFWIRAPVTTDDIVIGHISNWVFCLQEKQHRRQLNLALPANGLSLT